VLRCEECGVVLVRIPESGLSSGATAEAKQ
jgi:hypothetical protein